jgi:hypothetical protein
MKKILLAASFLPLVLAGCDSAVPNVQNPHNIVVNGEKMTQAAFLKKYCTGDGYGKTCMAVQQAMRSDATKGPVPKGW